MGTPVHPSAHQRPHHADGNVPDYPYQPPAVVITTPQNGAIYRAAFSFNSVPILADVFDPDSDLSEVRIYHDGTLLTSVTVLLIC